MGLIDLTRQEEIALTQASRRAGEYLSSLGIPGPQHFGLTMDQWREAMSCAVAGFQENLQAQASEYKHEPDRS